MKHWSIRNSKAFKFFSILIIFGIILGVVFYFNLSKETKESIITTLVDINKNLNNSKQNNIIYHLFIISTFLLLSMTIILFPITIIYLLYDIVAFGFILAYYLSNFGIGGLLYSLIYFLLNKAIFLIILIYLSLVSYKLIKKMIKAIYKKENIGVRELYQNYFYKIIISFIFMLITDIFIYFFGNKILSLFQFLL